MQEHERPDRHTAGSSRPGIEDDLATRLDQLSLADAERVLERAIRIQSHRHAADNFTREQIHRIAGELGLEDSVVDRAIREEVSQVRATERRTWLVPPRLTDRTVVSGSAEAVSEYVMAWMENEEGLRPVARTGSGIRWEPDRHWLTSTRLALGTGGTKALRGMPEVLHHQSSLGPEEQLIELDVDTGRIRNTAWGLGAGVAVTGLASGAAVAVMVPGGNDLVQFASAAVPGLVLATTTTVVTARAWASSLRRGIARALDGIAHPELHRKGMRRRQRGDRRPGSRKGGFQRLVDDVVDAIDDLFA